MYVCVYIWVCVCVCVYIYIYIYLCIWGFSGGTSGKEPTCQGGDLRNMGSIPGWERSPGGGYGNSSTLAWRIPWTEGARYAIVLGVTKSQTGLKWLGTHVCIYVRMYLSTYLSLCLCLCLSVSLLCIYIYIYIYIYTHTHRDRESERSHWFFFSGQVWIIESALSVL